MHWNRWRRHGDVRYVSRVFGPVALKIEAYRDKRQPDECWPWTGKINYNGYGRVSHEGRLVYAHRVVYELEVGPIPDGLDIDHECHNQDPGCPGGWVCVHRACLNPAHLFPRTRGENMRRAHERR